MNDVRRRYYAPVLVLLIAAVVPFFLLVHYAQPSADDFCYADMFRHNTFWNGIKEQYLGHKGRYATLFFTAAFHRLGGMLLTYQYAMFLFLAALSVAAYVFVRALFEDATSPKRTIFLALALGALYLDTMTKVSATLYWLDGALQYQLGAVFVLLSLAALLTLHRTGRWPPAAAACACIFVAVGATEIAMMTLAAVVAVMAFNRMYLTGRDRKQWTAVILVTVLSSALLLLAPGNYVREQYAAPGAGRFWLSFSNAWYYGGGLLADWLSRPVFWLATAAFIAPALRLVYLDGVRRKAGWGRLAVIVALVPGLQWSFVFALWFAAADNPPDRMQNMMYLLFLIGWFTAVLELVAVIAGRCRLPFTDQVFPPALRAGNLAVAVLFAIFLVVQGHTPTAWGDLVHRARGYERQMQQRYATIANANEQSKSTNDHRVVVLHRITDPPSLLMYTDIQPDPRNWRNTCFARYFGLKAVVRR
ncbi:MAG: DUF6056 family protein [Arenicellales bacterium]